MISTNTSTSIHPSIQPTKMANFPIQKYPIVCNECPGQQFQSKEEAVKHVSDTHEIFTPNLVLDYINVDKFYIGFLNNKNPKKLGKKKFKWIKNPKNVPSCNGCDNFFSSWNEAGAHAIAIHKVVTDYGLCQMIGKDVITKIPEIRKNMYKCIYCPKKKLKVFQFPCSLKQHYIFRHGKSTKDASILANNQWTKKIKK